ncbi:MAG: pirin family protein [Chloroflexota bacterium]
MENIREAATIIEPKFVIEGAGVKLQRSISPDVSNKFDPFLLWDHFAFNDPVEGENPGFPMHPHRGIETVTYILDGSVRHRDSLGNSGSIGAGDIQWMTAGGGILHEEMPKAGEHGGIHGFQLWVNLPSALKMKSPRYQDVKSSEIPTITSRGASIRLIAGTLEDVQGPVTEIAADPFYADITLSAGSEFTHIFPKDHTVLAYLFEGSGTFGTSTKVPSVRLIKFYDGEIFKAKSGELSPMRFMLISGAPFKEPIVPYGPFVMNTTQEIQQALIDLRNGTFVKK